MVSGWLPWSAASLVSGVVVLLLALVTLPLTGDPAAALRIAHENSGSWYLSAFALVLASFCLTMGTPTLLALTSASVRRVGMVSVWVWAVGTIGLTGLGMMLALFEIVVGVFHPTPEQALAVLESGLVRWLVGWVIGSFALGELLVALALWRARSVARWVCVAMLVHTVSLPLTVGLDPTARAVHSLLLGAALLGVAIRASEQ